MPTLNMRTRGSATAREGRFRMRRSRGAVTGVLLVLLGVWGALIPFIGPLFDFAYTPDTAWEWTQARGLLSVLPGAATVLGGLILLGSGNRASATLGSWLAAAAGAWFVVGPVLAGPWNIGDVGTPTGTSEGMRALEELAFFSLLGVVIVFLAATAQGRTWARAAAVRREPVVDEPAAAGVPDGRPAHEAGPDRPAGTGRSEPVGDHAAHPHPA